MSSFLRRCYPALAALTLALALPSSNSLIGGGTSGWGQIPTSAHSFTAMLAGQAVPSTVPFAGSVELPTSNFRLAQTMDKDLRLLLPSGMVGAVAYVADPKGGTTVMPTIDRRFVLPSDTMHGMTGVGIGRLDVVFVAASSVVSVSITLSDKDNTVLVTIP